MAVLYVFPVANTEYVQFNDQNNDFITSIHYSELLFGMDSNANVQFSHRRESAQLFPIQAAPFAEVLNKAGTPYSAVSLDAFIAAFTAALPLSGAAAGGGGGSAPDIATYSIGVDTTANNAWVRILTVFDPVTNVPTRSFFQLNGTTAYTPSTTAAAIIDAEGLLKNVYTATSSSLVYTDAIERRLGNIMTAAAIIDNSPSTDAQPAMTFNQTIVEVPLGSGDIAFNTSAGAQQVQIVALSGTFTIDSGSGAITYPLATAGGGVIPSFSLEAPFSKTLPSIKYIITDGSSVLLTQLLPTV